MKLLGINGFGRIGRNFLKILLDSNSDLKVVAINDLTSPKILAHLFKYDSCFGIYDKDVTYDDNSITINGYRIEITSESNPEDIPWDKFNIDFVIESTGKFKKRKQLENHMRDNVRKVFVSYPIEEEDLSIVMGVNHKDYQPDNHHIISNTSCTTNCLAPIAKIIEEEFKIQRGFMTTIHSYTNDQRILDAPHKDLRRSRAAAVSMIPTTTGATKSVEKVVPSLKGKLQGLAVRVPTSSVSLVDVVFNVEKRVTKELVNEKLREAACGDLKGILGMSNDSLVSIDFKGDSRSSIVDEEVTMVKDSNMIKILSWYDNEWGYSNRLVDLVKYVSNFER